MRQAPARPGDGDERPGLDGAELRGRRAVVVALAPKLRVTPQIFGGNTVDTPLSLTAGTLGRLDADHVHVLLAALQPRRRPRELRRRSRARRSRRTRRRRRTSASRSGSGSRARIRPAPTSPITNHTFPIVDKAAFRADGVVPALGRRSRRRRAPAHRGHRRLRRRRAASETSFAWQRCDATGEACQPIATAKKIVYFPTRQDIGYTIRIVVTATNTYGSLVAQSDPTEPIAALPPHRRGRHIVGTAKRDYLAGGGYDDVILGLAGNDTLLGGAGDDRIDGGAGNDIITGGAGADRLFGGTGSDTIYAADGERDIVDCGAGRDRAVVDSFDKVVNCEVVDLDAVRERRESQPDSCRRGA